MKTVVGKGVLGHFLLRVFRFPPVSVVCGGAVGRGTALQAGRSQVRFPLESLEFFIELIFVVALWRGVDSASNRNEYQESFLGVKTAGA
jgi:hypothetical protein